MKKRKDGYLRYLEETIDKKLFLLEAGQGKHANGNVFALLSCLEKDAKWESYRICLVATEESKLKIKEKLKQYGLNKVKVVIRNSDAYNKALATAGYLITDNSFPTYFVKREGQKYLNTWHGTPLKCLGRADISNSTSIGNVQKNFLSADYLLFPNKYTKEIMMKDYMIDRLFANKTVICDYPRNDVLFNAKKSEEVRNAFGLNGKNVFAYMPTWRGTGREVDIEKQVEESEKAIREIEACLGDNDVLFVNFHFLVGDRLDYSKFEKVKPFPENYETYEFLCACNTLISDYSSVIIDFAQTGKNVIMYMYDYEDYFESKGFYFDIRKLPFHQAYNKEELAEVIVQGPKSYELNEDLVGCHFGNASDMILQLMCQNKDEGLSIEDYSHSKDTTLLYAGDFSDEINCKLTQKILEEYSDEEREKIVIGFESELEDHTIDFLSKLYEKTGFVRFPGKGKMSKKERVLLHINRDYGLFNRTAHDYYVREHNRLFRDLNCKKISFLNTDVFYRIGSITAGEKETEIHKIPMEFYGRPNEVYYRHPKAISKLFSSFDNIVKYDKAFALDLLDNQKCKGIHAVLGKLKVLSDVQLAEIKGNINLTSPDEGIKLKDFVEIGSRVYSNVIHYPVEWERIKKINKGGLFSVKADFSIKVPVNDFSKWYSRNMFSISINVAGHDVIVPVLSGKISNPFKKCLFRIAGTEYVCKLEEEFKYIRLMIRSENVTDSVKERIKLLFAFALSRITFWYKPILLYEKDCFRYEESASVLLEKLVDSGKKDVRFILDNSYRQLDDIDDKYRKYIIDRFSFGHYYNLFACKSIFSSEALGHALEKKCANRLFKKFFINGKKNYVFLQHGVMYMVSLDSEQRSFFRKKEAGGKQRVVVSSELEASHFTEKTNYTKKDIYVCGLPKFDRNRHDENAEKIVIMTTWRPWEYVNGSGDLKQTGYYKMLLNMVNSVPAELKEKLIVLPHPLIQNQVQSQTEDPVWKYYIPGEKYDSILSKARLLITDYSSIAYDAFYRGVAVIFCWWDKDNCMKEYGGNAHLMLTEKLAFGDVCTDYQQLSEVVNRVYSEKIKEEYIYNYRKIVEFNDGNNTKRLITMAKEDGLL